MLRSLVGSEMCIRDRLNSINPGAQRERPAQLNVWSYPTPSSNCTVSERAAARQAYTASSGACRIAVSVNVPGRIIVVVVVVETGPGRIIVVVVVVLTSTHCSDGSPWSQEDTLQ